MSSHFLTPDLSNEIHPMMPPSSSPPLCSFSHSLHLFHKCAMIISNDGPCLSPWESTNGGDTGDLRVQTHIQSIIFKGCSHDIVVKQQYMPIWTRLWINTRLHKETMRSWCPMAGSHSNENTDWLSICGLIHNLRIINVLVRVCLWLFLSITYFLSSYANLHFTKA